VELSRMADGQRSERRARKKKKVKIQISEGSTMPTSRAHTRVRKLNNERMLVVAMVQT
jgi:hypothetical protein